MRIWKKDFSRFDRSGWPPRTLEDLQEAIKKLKTQAKLDSNKVRI